MRCFVISSFLAFLASGCGTSMYSVVYEGYSYPYQSPTVIITYDSLTLDFSTKLKSWVESTFILNQYTLEVVLLEDKRSGSPVLSKNDVDSLTLILADPEQNDLLLIFNPTYGQVDVNVINSNERLISLTYQLIGIDTKSKKRIWEAIFDAHTPLSSGYVTRADVMESLFYPNGGSGRPSVSIYAEKAAKVIFEKLKSDKILVGANSE